jgi:solute:Na+ symporter, SSS family
VVLATFKYDLSNPASRTYALTMLITVGVTSAVWLTVTMLTPPESQATLDRFYRRVRPGGPGWRSVAERLGYGSDRIPGGALSWVNWVAGVLAVYCAVVSLGALLTGVATRGVLYGIASIAAFLLIYRNLRADDTLVSGVDTTTLSELALDR